MDYWKKQTEPLFKDLEWNFPEKKSNTVSIIGGNSNNFSNIIKLAEYLSTTYPVNEVKITLPDALKNQLPPLPGLNLVKSTDSGSFAKSIELNSVLKTSDFSILAGDFSKNSATTIALSEAASGADCPLVLTRDAVDLLTPEMPNLIEEHRFIILASMAQLQKLFRALLYPKMVLLSEPLLPTLETLHKFTLSYENSTIITLHQNQIIIANGGKIITTPIDKTKYSPLTLFTSHLPVDLTAYNLWNPGAPLEASSAALLH